MTKSEIFRKAHEITRSVLLAGDNYRVTFAAALKSLMSKTVNMVEALTAIGGNLWEKAGMARIYFNDLESLMGLRISRYNTGNISSASLNGESISNSGAQRMLNSVDKIWFDLADGKFYYRASDVALANQVVAAIRAKIA